MFFHFFLKKEQCFGSEAFQPLRLQLASMLESQFSAPSAPEGESAALAEASSEWLDGEAVQQWLQTAGLRVSQ